MIQNQGRHIRCCGAILATLLLAAAGASVQGAPTDGPGRGPAVSARGDKAAGRGKQRPARPRKSANRSTGNRRSGRDVAPPPQRRQPKRPTATRGTQRREAGRPRQTRETRPKTVRRTGGQRETRTPGIRRKQPKHTSPRRQIGTRPSGGKRAPGETPRIDPRKSPERKPTDGGPRRPSTTNREPKSIGDKRVDPRRRVIIHRLDDRPDSRPTPDLGPDVTERGPTIRRRPDVGIDSGPPTQSIPKPPPGDTGGTSVSPRPPNVGIDGSPPTQSIPRRPPGNAGGTSVSPRRPDTHGRPPGGTVDDRRPHVGDDGSNPGGQGGKGKKHRKDGKTGRHKGAGHKGHHKHHRSCHHHYWYWYWGWYWCYPGYRYSRYCGRPWYGYWPYYDRYGCGYGYWPYWDRYGYSSYDDAAQPSYATYTDASYTPIVYTPEPCPWTQAEAWELLAGGRPGEAVDAFDCLAEALPDDGLPLVGSALAAALRDEHESAIATMREALRVDPESLRYVPDDERLHGQLAQLVEHYEYRARHQYGDLDALFMVAALWYLLSQEHTAHYAIDVGVTLGDADPSALSLKTLIESALE